MTFNQLAQGALWLFVLTIVMAVVTVSHVVLTKREPRAALGWVGLILLVPLLGVGIYYVFGINRVSRRAEKLYTAHDDATRFDIDTCRVEADALEGDLQPQLADLARFVGRVVPGRLYRGNRVEPLTTGAIAYGAMLEAIDGATETLALSTYIFDHDPVGTRFRRALVRAKERGVEVRVLIDAMGDRYTLPTMRGQLASEGIEARAFLPTLWPQYLAYSNLRNHRKLLVVDGTVAFTGGMNIRHGHLLEDDPPSPVRDMHFRLEGPIVGVLLQTFANDWHFTTGETIGHASWLPDLCDAGPVVCRAIEDDPARRFGHLHWTLLGALACARRRVRIVTPYFLPEEALTMALATTARRGVEVQIVLPEENNLSLVQWASVEAVRPLLETGCTVHLTPAPFDHTKLFVVDDEWSLVGSANWDPRSLRLNFELNVECYSRDLATRLNSEIDERLVASRPFTLDEIDARPLPVRLRDGLARLATPYL